jgi:hypothetical protein
MLTRRMVRALVIIVQYREERDEEGIIYIISEEDSVCPVCIGKLKVIGSRRRGLTNSAGYDETLVIRRLRCKRCGKIHHELPDKVIPYKRHCTETVENIINGEVDDVCCDFVTEDRIRAWWAGFQVYFESVLASLRMKYGAVFSPDPTPREIVRAVANTNLWVHTRTATMRL